MPVDKKKKFFGDVEKLRLDPDGVDGAGVEQEVEVSIPAGRPSPRAFFRVHPDPAKSLVTTVIVDREEMRNDTYIVAPEMRSVLAGDLRTALLVPAVTMQGVRSIWPIILPLAGRPNRWHERARVAAERAKRRWVRMTADVLLGTYRIYEATGEWPEPTWPDMTIGELLEMAFAGKIIEDENHPLARQLLGLG